ncbi:RHS repeat-associated core domain-containing protein [Iodobacter fluviatilis]|uniref:Cell wall-associated polypeptide CWBP200 n=1 Tax=Iodobacter fluviatilis TaxID=537 RepID=A0A377Q7Q7_9NEIS|nr:RHS repeat-associated core domain-containing protein [Iodobacter fluviatilis]TCU82633.1 RHS repeat-associated protein [Iodobacter fluviatilis]STQ89881.1 Cell wall-associated polypeptide CWBP200 [Iodobacter fluviatilis]
MAYYHVDHLGTPQTLSDENGEIAWSAEYKAWGEAQVVISEAAKTAGINNPIRFQGQYFDEESGLHYNRHRYYDPEIGRFISSDPIGLMGGFNTHAYAPNPTGWIDPLGLAKIFNKSCFNSPSNKQHTTYQQDINWDLPANTRNGVKTNLELANEGKSPFVVKNGKYSQLNLHHSKQDANGSLFELSADTHQKYYGSNALHPYLPNAHPERPVDRDSFNLDRDAYWKDRAQNEVKRRNGKGCQ